MTNGETQQENTQPQQPGAQPAAEAKITPEKEYEDIKQALTDRQIQPDPTTGKPIQEPGWILPSIGSKAAASSPTLTVGVNPQT